MITLIFATFVLGFFFKSRVLRSVWDSRYPDLLKVNPHMEIGGCVMRCGKHSSMELLCLCTVSDFGRFEAPVRVFFLFSGCSDTLYTSLHTSPVYTAVCLSPPQTVKGDDCL